MKIISHNKVFDLTIGAIFILREIIQKSFEYKKKTAFLGLLADIQAFNRRQVGNSTYNREVRTKPRLFANILIRNGVQFEIQLYFLNLQNIILPFIKLVASKINKKFN